MAALSDTTSIQKKLSSFFNSLEVMIFLYPLERIQTNLQIKHTYLNAEISQCKQFITRCTHYGIRSWFRGLTPNIVRATGTFSVFQLVKENSSILEGSPLEAIQGILPYVSLGAAYTLLYPFENIKMRMCAVIGRERTYLGIRDCANKMRKLEGSKAFYRGFSLALPHLLLQYELSTAIYKQILALNNQRTTGILEFISAFLLSSLVLHPLDTIKQAQNNNRKAVQINGAMNHENKFHRYRDAFRLMGFSQLMQGFSVRIVSGILSTVALVVMQKNQSSIFA